MSATAIRRTIAAVTGSRADYGLLKGVLREIREDPALELQLVVTGMHLAADFGSTCAEIEQDGFEIAARVESLLPDPSEAGVLGSIGKGMAGFAECYARLKPDLVLVFGDRYELLPACVGALVYRFPLAHIGGGATSQGAFDEAIRHAITKMASLHFTTTEAHRRRVIQLGEQPNRVFMFGSPVFDAIHGLQRLARPALETELDFSLEPPCALCTFHPQTLAARGPREQLRELLAALRSSGLRVLFTKANADTGGLGINEDIERFVASEAATCKLFENLGQLRYFSLLEHVSVMVGNSSSGIIEAASFKLPVVNVGDRQKGRIRGHNVIDVPCERSAIAAALDRARGPAFRASMKELVNPYDECADGQTARKIVKIVRDTALDESLTMKEFFDVELGAAMTGRPGEA